MENFFNYLTQPLGHSEVDIWFKTNNIVFEKMDLFYDFTFTLVTILYDTYLGGSSEEKESKIEMSDDDNINHFNWCWKKTIESFRKENIIIKENGEHKEYFELFFLDSFYNQKDFSIKESISLFLVQIFKIDNAFSKSDLDLMTELYKLLEKNIE